ncbi:serine/threonine-protein kinase [Streptomyces sp. NPDC059009]|uniref:serine/threonine-protein kinase n=1 Tax=Streptomyces sp. NPDC059009 TaxID=3346694 RepID=UPI00367BC33E
MGGAVPKPLREQDPREVSGYPVRARIGEGGMGTVYLSYSRGGQPVALKLIRAEYAEGSGSTAFRERFAREIAAAHHVAGYHLVPVVDHDAHAARPWLATRYVPGIPLDDALDDHGPLPAATVLQLAACTARALSAVHLAGVIHRDVKPGNLLLAADGPWLLDFGIARAAGATLTTVGRLVGTPRYMSPEHALGQPLTPAADVFALGLVAAEAAAGRHPFGRGNGLAIAARIAGTDREPPALDDVPEPVRALVRSCLAARPEDRPTAARAAELFAAAFAETAGRDAQEVRDAHDVGEDGGQDAVGGVRDIRDFTGWLPAPVAADVTRVQASLSPAVPAPSPVPLADAETVRALPPTAPLTVRDESGTSSEWSRRVRREP